MYERLKVEDRIGNKGRLESLQTCTLEEKKWRERNELGVVRQKVESMGFFR